MDYKQALEQYKKNHPLSEEKQKIVDRIGKVFTDIKSRIETDEEIQQSLLEEISKRGKVKIDLFGRWRDTDRKSSKSIECQIYHRFKDIDKLDDIIGIDFREAVEYFQSEIDNSFNKEPFRNNIITSGPFTNCLLVTDVKYGNGSTFLITLVLKED